MHQRIFFAAAALAAVSSVQPAWADWTGKGEAGLVVSSGNTNTETINAKLQLTSETETWKNTFGGSELYTSDDEGRTAQRWEAFGQSDYKFGARAFSFAAGRYEQDEFSGFKYQAIASGGVGYRFIDSPTTRFTGTTGVGYKFFETRDSFDDVTGALVEEGRSDSEVVFRGTIDFEHHFTASTTLLNKFIVESGADNTFLQNDLSLQVKMNAVLALAVGYSVRHNTAPPADFQNTDTLTTVNLVYEIK
jgi:putative salt-induced outer membrane protein